MWIDGKQPPKYIFFKSSVIPYGKIIILTKYEIAKQYPVRGNMRLVCSPDFCKKNEKSGQTERRLFHIRRLGITGIQYRDVFVNDIGKNHEAEK